MLSLCVPPGKWTSFCPEYLPTSIGKSIIYKICHYLWSQASTESLGMIPVDKWVGGLLLLRSLLNIVQFYFILNYPPIREEWRRPPELWSIRSYLLGTFSVFWIKLLSVTLGIHKTSSHVDTNTLSCSHLPVSARVSSPFLPIPSWERAMPPLRIQARSNTSQVKPPPHLSWLPTSTGGSLAAWLCVPRSFQMP